MLAVGLCAAAGLIFLLVFCFLQFRAGECPCSRTSGHKYARARSTEDVVNHMAIPKIDAMNGLSTGKNPEYAAQAKGLLDVSDSDSALEADNDMSVDITDISGRVTMHS